MVRSACLPQVQIPDKAPEHAGTYNGHYLIEMCITKAGPYNVYAIGDWGGITYGPLLPPVPADKRSKFFPLFHRKFVKGVDDRAQVRVAAEMRSRAVVRPPDYILNVGDNFYWGGVNGRCGKAPHQETVSSQWKHVFEQVYWGPGLEGKPWFGVLGNHDWGGYKFTAAWESNIGYTWGGGGDQNSRRWVQPALYYGQKVNYPGFSVLYLFVDTNVFEAWSPAMNPSHNICGMQHNGKRATCGPGGPPSIWQCRSWFYDLWAEQLEWMEHLLQENTATFQVIVTHFPPQYGLKDWKCLAERYGIDVFVSGHIHKQRIYGPSEHRNELKGTCNIISGGGGGITSEDPPSLSGYDDAYGFVHLTLTGEYIQAEAISHNGIMRKVVKCPPRQPKLGDKCAAPARKMLLNTTDLNSPVSSYI